MEFLVGLDGLLIILAIGLCMGYLIGVIREGKLKK